MEQISLTTPEAKPSNAAYAIDRLTLDFTAGICNIQLLGQNGEILSKVYNKDTTPTGAALMTALNKADLSVKSLHRRILERLIADGVITGSVSGVPA